MKLKSLMNLSIFTTAFMVGTLTTSSVVSAMFTVRWGIQASGLLSSSSSGRSRTTSSPTRSTSPTSVSGVTHSGIKGILKTSGSTGNSDKKVTFSNIVTSVNYDKNGNLGPKVQFNIGNSDKKVTFSSTGTSINFDENGNLGPEVQFSIRNE